MSIKAIDWAYRQKVGSPTRKLVLLKIADNANDEGFCFPGQRYIAQHCEMTRESVNRHIRRLVADGFITIESDEKKNRMGIYAKAKLYRVTMCDKSSHVTKNEGECDNSSHLPVTDNHTEPSFESSEEAFALNGAKPAPAEEPPYEQIKDLYNQLCPSLKACRKMTPKRRKAIRRLWKTDAPTIEHWEALFEDCENRDAWAGRLEPRPPYEHPFRANFDFVVDEENIAKVLESE